MEKIQLTVQSRVPHVSQIITGFLILKEQGCDIEIIDNSADKTHPLHELPAITAKVGGKTVVYDLWDGYNDPEDRFFPGTAPEFSRFFPEKSCV